MSEEPDLQKFKINGVTVYDAVSWFPDLTGGPTGSFSSRDKGKVDGIAIHHDAVAYGGTTVAEERARMQATFNFHTKYYHAGWATAPPGTGWNWPGIGYHLYTFPSGHIYEVGRLGLRRAHVSNENHRLMGVVMAGNFMAQAPVVGSVLGAGAAVHYLWGWRGKGLTVKGHREWGVPGHTPCPGDTFESWLPDVTTVADTLAAVGDGSDADAAIRTAITPAFEAGNWKFLHEQLHFIGF